MLHQSLKDITIIDLSMGWAGPLACRHAADMGAHVIKVESCQRFDWWRSWEATPEWIADDGAEKSSAFNMVNRNKYNITLDLENDRGRDILLQLVQQADAVVENFSGGVLGKLNLGYKELCKANKDIVLLSMPAFGASGPWAEYRAYGSTVEHSSGLPHLNGQPQDPPTMQHVALGDAVGGITGASALMVALWHQAKTGQGQFVDLSQVEGLFPLASHGILEFSATGKAPKRYGNDHPDYAPVGVYPCQGEDAWIVLEIPTQVEWLAFNQLAQIDDFDDPDVRRSQRRTLDSQIGRWTHTQSAQTIVERLTAMGVLAAACTDSASLLDHPQLAARGFWQWLDRAVVGNQPNPSAPYRDQQGPLPISRPAPTLGQHNQQIFSERLNLSDQEITDLEADGIIGSKPRMPTKKPAS